MDQNKKKVEDMEQRVKAFFSEIDTLMQEVTGINLTLKGGQWYYHCASSRLQNVTRWTSFSGYQVLGEGIQIFVLDKEASASQGPGGQETRDGNDDEMKDTSDSSGSSSESSSDTSFDGSESGSSSEDDESHVSSSQKSDDTEGDESEDEEKSCSDV